MRYIEALCFRFLSEEDIIAYERIIMHRLLHERALKKSTNFNVEALHECHK